MTCVAGTTAFLHALIMVSRRWPSAPDSMRHRAHQHCALMRAVGQQRRSERRGRRAWIGRRPGEQRLRCVVEKRREKRRARIGHQRRYGARRQGKIAGVRRAKRAMLCGLELRVGGRIAGRGRVVCGQREEAATLHRANFDPGSTLALQRIERVRDRRRQRVEQNRHTRQPYLQPSDLEGNSHGANYIWSVKQLAMLSRDFNQRSGGHAQAGLRPSSRSRMTTALLCASSWAANTSVITPCRASSPSESNCARCCCTSSA